MSCAVHTQELYQAGEKKLGTDESKFNQILCAQSYEQLRQVFQEYKNIAHKSLEQSIKSEMSGDLESGMGSIGNISVILFRLLVTRIFYMTITWNHFL